MPLLTVVLGFDLKAATGLSHTIVGASPFRIHTMPYSRTHSVMGELGSRTMWICSTRSSCSPL